MSAHFLIPVSTAGLLVDPATGKPYFATSGGLTIAGSPVEDSSLFIGVSGVYTGLTFTIQGAIVGGDGVTFYDIVGITTTDSLVPLLQPLAPADGSSVAYTGDIRAFNLVQINVVTLTSGKPTIELQAAQFGIGLGG